MDPVRATIGIVVSFLALLVGVAVMGLFLPDAVETPFGETALTIADIMGLVPHFLVGVLIVLLGAIIVFLAARVG